MNEIKEYQEMCIIYRKNGDEIYTKASLGHLEQLINNGPQMIRFGDELVNKYEITGVKKVVMGELDTYIASITDNDMKSKLRKIVKERKDKGLTVNGVKHLMEIYENRFNS